MTFTLFEIAVFLITYFICSISPAIILCRLIKKQDIREFGSGNAGTTNAIRTLGKFYGFVVFILDILKVLLSYYVIYILCNIFKVSLETNIESIFLVGAVIGHCYPVYYGLKGGKGIVAIMTSMFIINEQVAIVVILSGLFIILITRTVSIGTISGVVLLIIMTFVMNIEYIIPVLITSFIVLFKHRSNISRILKKEEKRLF